jgi:regulatory protein
MVERTEQGREENAYRRAIRILSHRDHSIEELRRKLKQRGFSEEIIRSVVRRLARARLLDDARFAEMFVREKVLQRPMGRQGLLRELARRGVDGDVAGRALCKVLEEAGVDEADLARKVLDRVRGGGVRDVRGLLRRRGFDADVIRVVFDELDDHR